MAMTFSMGRQDRDVIEDFHGLDEEAGETYVILDEPLPEMVQESDTVELAG